MFYTQYQNWCSKWGPREYEAEMLTITQECLYLVHACFKTDVYEDLWCCISYFVISQMVFIESVFVSFRLGGPWNDEKSCQSFEWEVWEEARS
jgi:hypothetical protein